MLDTGLRDRVAIVTGANHGIGAATARLLASEGAKVFITYLCRPPEHWGLAKEAADGGIATDVAPFLEPLVDSRDLYPLPSQLDHHISVRLHRRDVLGWRWTG